MRDFALYWTARTVSFLGDGVMVVALPFLFADAEGGPRTFPVVPILTAIVVLSGLSAMLSTSCARRLGSPGARA